MKIKIISAPAGQFPEWFKDTLVGLELETINDHTGDWINFGEVCKNSYWINIYTFINKLQKKDPEAYNYFIFEIPSKIRRVIFAAEYCKVLED